MDTKLEIQQLERVRQRLKLGAAYTQARAGSPVEIPQKISDAIFEGKISATVAISALLESKKITFDLKNWIKKKTFTPRLQSYLLCALVVLANLALAYLKLPSVPKLDLLSACLIALGFFWSQRQIQKIQNELWRLDWIHCLGHWEASLKWGETLVQAIQEHSLPQNKSSHRKLFRNFEQAIRSYQVLEKPGTPTQNYEELSLLAQAHAQGESCLELIELIREQETQSLKQDLELACERLALQQLLPLFFCFAPALILQVLGPTFATLSL